MRRAGFTILEMLIATALVGVMLAFTFETFSTNNQAYTNIDSIVDVQQRARVISDLIERDVRHAGLLLPEGSALCGIDDDSGPDTLYVTDHTVIATLGSTSYTGAEIVGAVANVNGSATLTLDKLFMEPTVANAAFDTNGDSTNDSDFQRFGGVIIFDANDTGRGTACGSVSGVSAGTNQIGVNITSGGLGAAAGPVDLFAVPAIEYRVTSGQLFRNGRRLSDDVEDFQVSYFFDLDGDDLIGANETRGDGTNPDYLASANDVTTTREVRVNLVVRAEDEDPDFNDGHFQALENRDPIAGTDGFRRRVYINTVRLRNVGDRAGGV